MTQSHEGQDSKDMLAAVVAFAGHELRSDMANLTMMVLQLSNPIPLAKTQGPSIGFHETARTAAAS